MQVKFRGKRAHDGAWVIGNLITANNGSIYIYEPKELIEDGHHLIIDSDEPHWVVPESVGMFTGLTDKNGKEIYGAIGEKGGDIVICKCSERQLHVEYVSSLAAFAAWEQPVDISLYKHQLHYFGEIIGNATDNPELLEK